MFERVISELQRRHDLPLLEFHSHVERISCVLLLLRITKRYGIALPTKRSPVVQARTNKNNFLLPVVQSVVSCLY